MSAGPNLTPGHAERAVAPSIGTVWVHRITTLLFVCVCAGLGVLCIVLPWTPSWTDNHFLMNSAMLHRVVANNFVRGMCSGLGLIDIWIGFWEALHYHERPAA